MADPEERTEYGVSRRVIKRYSNRKLYDTKDSKYVTLLEIADQIRAGEDIQVIDNASKEDKTEVTLALIISEELKAQPRGISQSTLKDLIRERGEKWLSQLREGRIGKLIPKEPEEITAEPVERPDDKTADPPPQPRDAPTKGIRATLEQWQSAIDERVRAIMPSGPSLSEMQAELSRLSDRISVIEAHLEGKIPHKEPQ